MWGDSSLVQERYLFYVLPLAGVAVCLQAARGWPLPRVQALLAAGLLLLSVRVPLSAWAQPGSDDHSPFLLAVERLQLWFGTSSGDLVVAAAAALLSVAAALGPWRPRIALPALLGASIVAAAASLAGVTALDHSNSAPPAAPVSAGRALVGRRSARRACDARRSGRKPAERRRRAALLEPLAPPRRGPPRRKPTRPTCGCERLDRLARRAARPRPDAARPARRRRLREHGPVPRCEARRERAARPARRAAGRRAPAPLRDRPLDRRPARELARRDPLLDRPPRRPRRPCQRRRPSRRRPGDQRLTVTAPAGLRTPGASQCRFSRPSTASPTAVPPAGTCRCRASCPAAATAERCADRRPGARQRLQAAVAWIDELGRGVRATATRNGRQHMTADVAFYVELAREADGPLVELAIGNGRVAIPVAQATGRPVIGIDSSPAMLDAGARPRGRGGRRARSARGRHARPRARRAGGADLLPVPRAPAPADLGRPAPHLRARRRLAAAGRTVRLERLRLRPPDRGARSTAQHQDEPVPHTIRYAVGDNRIDIILDDGARAPCGGPRRTSGSGSSMSPASSWRPLRRVRRRAVRDDSREYVFVARRPR